MRKTAETFNDIAMLFGMMKIKPAERLVQVACTPLGGDILRMGKGQIEED
jgi:hypothetical protein